MLYIAMRREVLPQSADVGMSTTVFFFENTLQRNPAHATKLWAHRPRPGLRASPAAAPSAQQGARVPLSIDWAQEAERAAADSIEDELRARRSGFGPAAEPVAAPRPFRWDYAHTHRVESLPGGGLLVNLNDRCSLVLKFPWFVGGCKIGQIESRGDLFAHMHDP